MRSELARERLWSKAATEPNTGCWLWPGSADDYGYGYCQLAGQRRVHRAAFVLWKGPIPAGLGVLHRCDMPPCFNPAHLFAGTPLDNMRDKNAKGRGRYPGAVRPQRGESHYRAVLTDSQVAEIRAAYVDGYGNQTRLARKYGVTPGAIWRIVRGRSRDMQQGEHTDGI